MLAAFWPNLAEPKAFLGQPPIPLSGRREEEEVDLSCHFVSCRISVQSVQESSLCRTTVVQATHSAAMKTEALLSAQRLPKRHNVLRAISICTDPPSEPPTTSPRTVYQKMFN
ncbi:unnamed protein product [Protopolystoma xenopodis]|uniref:Uncharacterized protein n=1 Tax=Protopolystoma xenopodis TaxID=117903 RepID=A0A448XPK0_9PLAT|nr:unnamed protein product [Protopolystoma xenopodis]